VGTDIHVPWWASDKAEEHVRNTRAKLRVAAELISAQREDIITVREIERGLVEVLCLNHIGDVLDRDVDTREIVSLLDGYEFMRLRPIRLCEIELAESIVPCGVTVLFTEAKVRLNGEIWWVYKSDADPFPSNPHAHNYQSRVKMHLGNGDLYGYKEKEPSGRLKKSVLPDFRGRVHQANSTIVLPPLAV
jgi:hypothetical protein